MPELEEILNEIYLAVDEINRQLPDGEKLPKAPGTVLLGSGGNLDSLNVVMLVVAVEEAVDERFGRELSLLSEENLADLEGPLHSIESLADYIRAQFQ